MSRWKVTSITLVTTFASFLALSANPGTERLEDENERFACICSCKCAIRL